MQGEEAPQGAMHRPQTRPSSPSSELHLAGEKWGPAHAAKGALYRQNLRHAHPQSYLDAGENIAARPSPPSPPSGTFSGRTPPMTADVLLETNRLASSARGLFLRPVVMAALCLLPSALGPGPCLRLVSSSRVFVSPSLMANWDRIRLTRLGADPPIQRSCCDMSSPRTTYGLTPPSLS